MIADMAPACATISLGRPFFSVGSVTMAASAAQPRRMAASVPSPESSSAGTATSTTRPAKSREPRAKVSKASSAATTPAFMSAAPRP